MTARVTLTPDQAKQVLKPGDTIHCFTNPAASVMIGADASRVHVHQLIDEARLLEVAGDVARGMGHGLVVHSNDIVRFFETDEAELSKLDPQSPPERTGS